MVKYPASIMQDFDEKQCFMCHSRQNLQVHHVMNGSNRKHSTEDGLVVLLCWECHLGNQGVHYNAEVGDRLKAKAQEAYEEAHTREEWFARYHKNYL